MALQFDPLDEINLTTVMDLVQAFHQEEGRVLDELGKAAVTQIAQGEPFARAWLLRQDGKAIGYVILTLGFSVEYGGRDGFIDDLYLVPGARGQGIGSQLLNFALARASELGIGTLHLEVETANENAMRLYRGAGFEETGRKLLRLGMLPSKRTTP